MNWWGMQENRHKGNADGMKSDIKGEWNASAGIACTEGSLMTMAIGETIRGDVQMTEFLKENCFAYGEVELP